VSDRRSRGRISARSAGSPRVRCHVALEQLSIKPFNRSERNGHIVAPHKLLWATTMLGLKSQYPPQIPAACKACPCSLNLLWARRRVVEVSIDKKAWKRCMQTSKMLEGFVQLSGSRSVKTNGLQFLEPASHLWTDGRSATGIRGRASSGQETGRPIVGESLDT
jgi:hypothetical protein